MKVQTYTVEIEKPLAEVYQLARQVERQPEFMPDYLSCRVVEREAERLLLERSAKIRNKTIFWQSWVSFRENEGVYFIHQGGPLDGMQVHWQFRSHSATRTQVTITQRFHVRHAIPFIGIILERWIFAPKLDDIAQRVSQSLKRACEGPAIKAAA